MSNIEPADNQDLANILPTWKECLEKAGDPIKPLLDQARLINFDGNYFYVETTKFVMEFINRPKTMENLNKAIQMVTGLSHISVKLSVAKDNQQGSKEDNFNPATLVNHPSVQKRYTPAPQPQVTPNPFMANMAPNQPQQPAFPVGNQAANNPISASGTLSIPQPQNISANISGTGLRPDLSFETFVCAENNKIAWAAAKAVAENPGTINYNPLFFHSGVGLGKTHLMNAIGNYILRTSPQKRVLYISAEQFTNELIGSINNESTARFRDKYRLVDVLLIDDIQFLINKEATQNEFFHTYNALKDSGKQIVISSDRPPKQFTTLADRLRTRLSNGIIVDIQPPDLETRIAILQRKAQSNGVRIPDDVLSFIAKNFSSNIRDLEGALVQVIAHCSLSGVQVTMDNIESILQERLINNSVNQILDIDAIKKAVCDYCNVTEEELIGVRRDQRIVKPRQIAMYLCRELSQASYAEIAKGFGDKDHTTVIHAVKKVENSLDDLYYKTTISNIKENLKNMKPRTAKRF